MAQIEFIDIRLIFPDETKIIELKHEETCLKRKEKIDQQIESLK